MEMYLAAYYVNGIRNSNRFPVTEFVRILIRRNANGHGCPGLSLRSPGPLAGASKT
jgi:hypothetical protein